MTPISSRAQYKLFLDKFKDDLTENIHNFQIWYGGERVPTPSLMEDMVEVVRKAAVNMAMTVCEGNQVHAANMLGINRKTIRKYIRMYGLRVVKYK